MWLGHTGIESGVSIFGIALVQVPLCSFFNAVSTVFVWAITSAGILRLDEVSAIGVVICLPPGCGSAGFGHSSEPADTVSGATADEQGEEPDGSVQWRVPDPSR